jgi:hypothetical protein
VVGRKEKENASAMTDFSHLVISIFSNVKYSLNLRFSFRHLRGDGCN